MDIIKQRQEQREFKISNIVMVIQKIKKNKDSIKYKDFIITIMDTFKMSRRFVVEYIDVALHRMGLKRGDIFK